MNILRESAKNKSSKYAKEELVHYLWKRIHQAGLKSSKKLQNDKGIFKSTTDIRLKNSSKQSKTEKKSARKDASKGTQINDKENKKNKKGEKNSIKILKIFYRRKSKTLKENQNFKEKN